MITLYIDGKPAGTWAEAERAFAESAGRCAVEFRDEGGRVIATSVPGTEPVDWQPLPEAPDDLPPPDLDGKTLDEWRRELGWDDNDGSAGPARRR